MAKRVSVKGKGADLFFGGHPAPQPPAPADVAEDLVPEDAGSEPGASPSPAEAPIVAVLPPALEPAPSPQPRASRRPGKRSPDSSQLARSDNSGIASTIASDIASQQPGDVEAIRKVVKTPGKEVSFVRLTPKEKEQLADVVYTYKRQGFKTTETEINRIAINALLADHRANGERSTLARVLAALQA